MRQIGKIDVHWKYVEYILSVIYNCRFFDVAAFIVRCIKACSLVTTATNVSSETLPPSPFRRIRPSDIDVKYLYIYGGRLLGSSIVVPRITNGVIAPSDLAMFISMFRQPMRFSAAKSIEPF